MKLIIKYGSKKYLLYTLIGLVIIGMEGFLLPLTIRIVVDSLTKGSARGLSLGIMVGILGFVIVGIGSYFYQGSLAKLIEKFNVNIKSLTYKNFIDHFSENSENKSSKVLSFIQNDLKLLEQNYIIAYINSIQTIFLASVSTIYVALTNVTLALIFIAFAFLPMLLPKITGDRIGKSAEIWTDNNEDYTKELTDSIKGAPTIKSYNREKTFFYRLKRKLILSEESNANMTKAQVVSNTLAYILSIICSLLPLYIGGFFVLQNRLEVGALVSIFMASNRIANPLTVAVQNYNKISTTNKIIERIEKIVKDTKPDFIDEYYKDGILPLEFHDASIGYQDDQPILESVSLKINNGDKILIKGESGSGKTTLLRAIQGINDPISGNINYGDNLQLSPLEITQSISYIRQTPIIFDDTIEFNITLGEKYSEEDLLKAVEKAGLSDVISEKGLDFQVGENGKNLSGGQNQRVEIARAVLRERELLIADEVTAALDNKTSESIRDTLFSIPQAVVEVSHHTKHEDLSSYDFVYQISEGILYQESYK